MHKYFRIIHTGFCNLFIKVLSIFIQKDYDLWFFGMDGGVCLAGNVLYFMQYVRRKHPHVRVVCMVYDSVLREAEDLVGLKKCMPNTLQSILVAAKAGVWICSGELAGDFVNVCREETIKINLWHGMPIKKINYSSAVIRRLTKKDIKQRIINYLLCYVKHEEYDFIACTSDTYKAIFKEAFNNENIFITGQPRDDIFYACPMREYLLQKYGLGKLVNSRIILYLPTFRDINKKCDEYMVFKDNPFAQNRLAQINSVVLQKDHQTPLQVTIVDGQICHLAGNVETQDLLAVADILITDYSSCFVDFLHTLRPIIFYPYDYQSYVTTDRELYFDYYDDTITPGVKAHNEDELIEAICRYVEVAEVGIELRKQSLCFFHKFRDGRSSERVYLAVTKLVDKKKARV